METSGTAPSSSPSSSAGHAAATEREIERLIAALHAQVEEGVSPDTLRYLTDELERRTRAERRCAELFESEQVARAEARESQAANRAKDQFLAVLSHELRAPLQPVIASAEALLRDPRVPADLLDDVRTIQRNVQFEARLIDDLLDLTKLTGGTLALERQRVNVESVISRAVEICEPDAMAKRLTLSLRFAAASRKWVHADPGRLQQVLWNLIRNAVKFTPDGGEILIETADASDADRVVVRVVDNGIGVEPVALLRIFDAFEQASDEVTRRHGGLGLGLAICKLLVERHEGTLSAQSDGPGRGATFTLSLPAIDAPPGVTAVPAGATPRGVYPPPVSAERRLRILLVEDDPDSAFVMARLLKSVGHDVTCAGDCASALSAATTATSSDAAVAAGKFDLLLCDLGLPDGSGLDVMSRLRHTGIRGIALTGYGSDRDIAASLAAGFQLHLTKPVTLERVVNAMAKLFPG